jgi:uncharacterized protein (DUF2336 family)
MSAVLSLIDDLDNTVSRHDSEKRAQTLRRVVDMFQADAEQLSEEQIDVFDVVIARLASEIEIRARIELSNRLADMPRAPRGIVKTLAKDEIGIAHPVLSRSLRLSDEDLAEVIDAKGQDHMLAMALRPQLSEVISESLVKRGDAHVMMSLAANSGVQFNEVALNTLMMRAQENETLRIRLDQRKDLPETSRRQLLAIAKETARLRLAKHSPAGRQALDFAIERGAADVATHVHSLPASESVAMAQVLGMSESGDLSQAALCTFAKNAQRMEAICAVSVMAGLNLPTAKKLFDGPEIDLLLVVGRSEDWNWESVQALLALRTDAASQKIQRLKDTYDQLSRNTAQRVMHFLKVREATQKKAAEAVAIRHFGAQELA